MQHWAATTRHTVARKRKRSGWKSFTKTVEEPKRKEVYNSRLNVDNLAKLAECLITCYKIWLWLNLV